MNKISYNFVQKKLKKIFSNVCIAISFKAAGSLKNIQGLGDQNCTDSHGSGSTTMLVNMMDYQNMGR
jgi:hypothetical protein